MDQIKELRSKIAILESKVDHLESEMGYINTLLVKCGFPEGIKTLTDTVEELLEEGFESPFPPKTKGFESF
jgi:hypothetical protein